MKHCSPPSRPLRVCAERRRGACAASRADWHRVVRRGARHGRRARQRKKDGHMTVTVVSNDKGQYSFSRRPSCRQDTTSQNPRRRLRLDGRRTRRRRGQGDHDRHQAQKTRIWRASSRTRVGDEHPGGREGQARLATAPGATPCSGSCGRPTPPRISKRSSQRMGMYSPGSTRRARSLAAGPRGERPRVNANAAKAAGDMLARTT